MNGNKTLKIDKANFHKMRKITCFFCGKLSAYAVIEATKYLLS